MVSDGRTRLPMLAAIGFYDRRRELRGSSTGLSAEPPRASRDSIRSTPDRENTMRLTRTSLSVLALLLASGAVHAQDYAIGALKISHPWTPATSESAKDAPGYVTIINTGREPDRLKGGSFAEAAHVEVHAGPRQGGAAQMAPAQGGLVIAPGETVTLRPGGDHLMFVGLRSPLERGATKQAILQFERSGALEVDFTVEGSAGKANGGRHPHGRGH